MRVTDAQRPVRPLAPWDDEAVQVVYEILCDSETVPPEGEHWEGYWARWIVGALMQRMEGRIPLPRNEDEAEAMARAGLMWLQEHDAARLHRIAA